MILFLIAGLLLMPLAAIHAAELKVARVFTDQTVLQREMAVPVWGWAEPGTEVTVEFAGQERTATADEGGKSMVRLDPMPASADSRELKVFSAGKMVTLSDILVGEVWLASGQSNMGFSISKSTHAEEARKLIVWYQGESNVGRAEPYRRQLPLMVTEWRKAFERDDLAFLAVQLPAYGKVRDWPSSPWAEIRESIAFLEKSLPHTASVVSTDCGLPDEIHPPLKRPIGQRLALAARAKVYGEDIVWSGPIFRKAKFHKHGAVVHFDHVGSGLVAGPLDRSGIRQNSLLSL